MVTLKALVEYTDSLLAVENFSDYCPNGLQVEGRPEVHCLVSGVTASLELVEAAIAAEADAILVHHGYFWKGEDECVTGMKRQRSRDWMPSSAVRYPSRRCMWRVSAAFITLRPATTQPSAMVPARWASTCPDTSTSATSLSISPIRFDDGSRRQCAALKTPRQVGFSPVTP